MKMTIPDWLYNLGIRLLMPRMSMEVIVVFYRGRIDVRGMPFGVILCNLSRLPWKGPLTEIPFSVHNPRGGECLARGQVRHIEEK